MIPLEEAQGRVVSACAPLPPVAVPIDACLGLVTGAPVVAAHDVPPFANTAMDGYAVRAVDTRGAPVELRVVGEVAAGADPSGITVGPGEAVRIMTGAPIPAGADAVVMVERTAPRGGGTAVSVDVEVPVGNHIRPAGEDLTVGQVAFEAGTVLGPGHLGVLASIGVAAVDVHPRVRVGVLSTGDELVEPGQPLGPGQIRDSNRRSLLALLAGLGAVPIDLGIARDTEEAIEAAIDEAVRSCDALLTSGGVSMGEYDYVKAVLDRRSDGGMAWMQVAIKPAKPLSFGVVDGLPVFGLPGNPVSSMVSFELFARPALRRLMGHRELHRRPVTAIADEPITRRADGKTHFVRVVAHYDDEQGRWRARPSSGQASNLLHAMAMADGLAVVTDGDGVAAGDAVPLLVLTP